MMASEEVRLCDMGGLDVVGDVVHLGVAFDGRLIVVMLDELAGSILVDLVSDDGALEQRSLEGLGVTHPFVQPTPDGELLIVAARSRWADGGAEPNAWLVARDGSVRRQFCLGDGVEALQVTPEGRVWAGYFDEGVFGNLGWGLPGRPEPLGGAGIVCWGLDGERLWDFSPPPGFDRIVDCYAMSATGEEVWACYDADFPIVRLRVDAPTVGWDLGIPGAGTIASTGDRVGLVGGYQGDHDRLVVASLGAETAASRVLRLVMPDGAALPESAPVAGRGRFVHAVVGGAWLRLDLDQVAAT